jgi:hypothetical protein
MRKHLTVALCCLTLLVVALDVALLHTRSVHADSVVNVRLVKIGSLKSERIDIGGETPIGFSCVAPYPELGTQCYVASR